MLTYYVLLVNLSIIALKMVRYNINYFLTFYHENLCRYQVSIFYIKILDVRLDNGQWFGLKIREPALKSCYVHFIPGVVSAVAILSEKSLFYSNHF